MFGRELDIAARGRAARTIGTADGGSGGSRVTAVPHGDPEAEGSESRSPLSWGRAGRAQAWLYDLGTARSSPWLNGPYLWRSGIALFVVYFWFGFIKLIGLSEATGLARALTAQTVGLAHFQALFTGLALFECVIGVLCLIPRGNSNWFFCC